ncbi:MAG: tRNA dimethylallyltransferase [Francisellaceae bacterium]
MEKRFHSMLQNGFMEEMEKLYKNKNLGLHLPSMRCVGYRQAWEHLSGDISYELFIEKSIIATRQLAKRQLTWLRNWQSCEINNFNCLDNDINNKIINFVANKLQRHSQ